MSDITLNITDPGPVQISVTESPVSIKTVGTGFSVSVTESPVILSLPQSPVSVQLSMVSGAPGTPGAQGPAGPQGAPGTPAEVLTGPDFTYTAGVLTSITYDDGTWKEFIYTAGVLTQIIQHSVGINKIKTFVYSAGILQRIDETTEVPL